MKHVFVLGMARSGTTWLGDLLGMTATAVKYIDEPFTKLRKDLLAQISDGKYSRPWFLPFNCKEEQITNVQDIIHQIETSNSVFQERLLDHVLKNNDEHPHLLLIKDVHNLGVYPRIVSGFNNYRSVVITRDIKRVLDSFLNTFGFNRPYLESEYRFVRHCLRKNKATGNRYLDETLADLPKDLKRYLKSRKSFYKNEVMSRAVIEQIMLNYLCKWADQDDRVMHVTHEELCQRPVEVTKTIYAHCELQLDGTMGTMENRVLEKSRGNNSGKFATSKNSKEVLTQGFKVLDEKMLEELSSMNL
jgi:hypothetical protein